MNNQKSYRLVFNSLKKPGVSLVGVRRDDPLHSRQQLPADFIFSRPPGPCTPAGSRRKRSTTAATRSWPAWTSLAHVVSWSRGLGGGAQGEQPQREDLT
jgi:hypothetical protein